MRTYGALLLLSALLIVTWALWIGSPDPNTGKSVSGYVVSQATGNPLMGVAVTIDAGRFADTTDGRGRYRIENLDNKVQELRFEHFRYNSAVLLGDAALAKIESGVLNIALTPGELEWKPLFSTGCSEDPSENIVLAALGKRRDLGSSTSENTRRSTSEQSARSRLYGRQILVQEHRGGVDGVDGSMVAVFVDTSTEIPTALSGRIPVAEIVPEVEKLTNDNAFDVALRFIRDNEVLLGVNSEELIPEQVESRTDLDRRFAVEISFIQVHQGLKVSDGTRLDIEKRIRIRFAAESLTEYYSEFEPNIELDLLPALTRRAALESGQQLARQKLQTDAFIDLDCHSMELIVFADRGVPITSPRRHRLCWSITAGEFSMFVDADTGELLRLTSLRMCGLFSEHR